MQYIKTYKGYRFNSLTGQVLRPNGRVVKNGCGIYGIRLRVTIGGKKRQFLAHHIMAKLFVANPHNYPCVRAKDGDLTNLLPQNLQWCRNKGMELIGSCNRKKHRSLTSGDGYLFAKKRALQNGEATSFDLIPSSGTMSIAYPKDLGAATSLHLKTLSTHEAI